MNEKPLKLTDMAGIEEMIIELISKYPSLPFKASSKTISWQGLGTSDGIGLITLSGAVYIKQYISGGFTAQMPFRIEYQTRPTTTKARLDAQKFVEDLSIWLEQCDATFKEDITLNKIERDTPVIKNRAYTDGSEVYSCTMNIKYSKN